MDYSNRKTDDLIRSYVRLDNNTTAVTIAEEARRMNACGDMWSELQKRHVTDEQIAAENKRYWQAQRSFGDE